MEAQATGVAWSSVGDQKDQLDRSRLEKELKWSV